MSKLGFYCRCISYFLISGVLIAGFLASMIQGLLMQLQGQLFNTIPLYVIAWVCLGTSIVFFNKALKLSKFANY